MKTLAFMLITAIAVAAQVAQPPGLARRALDVEHGAPGERLASPFGQPVESRIGEAAKVFRLTVRSVTR